MAAGEGTEKRNPKGSEAPKKLYQKARVGPGGNAGDKGPEKD